MRITFRPTLHFALGIITHDQRWYGAIGHLRLKQEEIPGERKILHCQEKRWPKLSTRRIEGSRTNEQSS